MAHDSQAPASSIARNLRAAKREGSQALGVQIAGEMTDSNATRDVDRLFNYFGMGLKVPRDLLRFTSTTGDVVELPWIRPSAWVKHLLEGYPFLLSGGKPCLGDETRSFLDILQASAPRACYVHNAGEPAVRTDAMDNSTLTPRG